MKYICMKYIWINMVYEKTSDIFNDLVNMAPERSSQ